ncbi:hypothetical protein IAR50_005576 [Cryptococcus sp. DSM 104548]
MSNINCSRPKPPLRRARKAFYNTSTATASIDAAHSATRSANISDFMPSQCSRYGSKATLANLEGSQDDNRDRWYSRAKKRVKSMLSFASRSRRKHDRSFISEDDLYSGRNSLPDDLTQSDTFSYSPAPSDEIGVAITLDEVCGDRSLSSLVDFHIPHQLHNIPEDPDGEQREESSLRFSVRPQSAIDHSLHHPTPTHIPVFPVHVEDAWDEKRAEFGYVDDLQTELEGDPASSRSNRDDVVDRCFVSHFSSQSFAASTSSNRQQSPAPSVRPLPAEDEEEREVHPLRSHPVQRGRQGLNTRKSHWASVGNVVEYERDDLYGTRFEDIFDPKVGFGRFGGRSLNEEESATSASDYIPYSSGMSSPDVTPESSNTSPDSSQSGLPIPATKSDPQSDRRRDGVTEFDTSTMPNTTLNDILTVDLFTADFPDFTTYSFIGHDISFFPGSKRTLPISYISKVGSDTPRLEVGGGPSWLMPDDSGRTVHEMLLEGQAERDKRLGDVKTGFEEQSRYMRELLSDEEWQA